MHAAIVADPACRLIVETTEHHAAGCEGLGYAVGIIGVIVILGIQNSNENTPSSGSERRDRGISIPVILNEPNNTARVRKGIADGSCVVGQSGKGIFFHR